MDPKKKGTSVISLGDIAKEAGVSRMTVSFALRNKPEVNPKTRDRIHEIAQRLGYIPDARMGIRMAQVRETKTRDLLPLAWLDLNTEKGMWSKKLTIRPYLKGATERCLELGYQLEQFWVREPGMTARRISQILYHRGIQGVIVCPPAHLSLNHLKLNWPSLSCATFEKALSAPRMHRVAQDHYYNVMLALKLLRRFGYKRIAVLIQQQADRRSAHAVQAAIGYFQTTIHKSERVPPMVHSYADIAGESFYTWIKKVKPDVIVGQHSKIVEWVQTAGFKVPEEVGVVHLAVDDDCLEWAGIIARRKEIGAATANLVISQIQNNQLGLPKVPMDTLVQGSWQAGKTLLIPKPS